MVCQSLCNRLNHVEDPRNIFLVVRQYDAHREGVCDEQGVLSREGLDGNNTCWRELVIFIRRYLDLKRFLLSWRYRSNNSAI